MIVWLSVVTDDHNFIRFNIKSAMIMVLSIYTSTQLASYIMHVC